MVKEFGPGVYLFLFISPPSPKDTANVLSRESCAKPVCVLPWPVANQTTSPVYLQATETATSVKCSHPKASQAVSVSEPWFLLGSFLLSSHIFYIFTILEVFVRFFQFFSPVLCLSLAALSGCLWEEELFSHCVSRQALRFLLPINLNSHQFILYSFTRCILILPSWKEDEEFCVVPKPLIPQLLLMCAHFQVSPGIAHMYSDQYIRT